MRKLIANDISLLIAITYWRTFIMPSHDILLISVTLRYSQNIRGPYIY